jgi:hypothetical protein
VSELSRDAWAPGGCGSRSPAMNAQQKFEFDLQVLRLPTAHCPQPPESQFLSLLNVARPLLLGAWLASHSDSSLADPLAPRDIWSSRTL